ncbi:MAG: glycoside hydrolase family 3 N-terminal domain-containing protein, partial [Terracidiphilus sp.]
LAPLPAVQSVARAGLGREHGVLAARAVKAFGFNTTLAPVLDLGLPESAAVLGTRTAAAGPAGVVRYARDFLAGLRAENVAGCGKHFPGLGGGTLDSHLETPAIDRPARALWDEDLEPYRALRGELPMVMIAHAAYPRTPGRGRPASVSRYWIETLLRQRIGFRGLILSDDLEMGGILKFMSVEEAAIESIRAGSDLLAICHNPELVLRSFEALLAEFERSPAFARLLQQHAHRAARHCAALYPSELPPALPLRQFEALRTRILAFAARVEKAQESRPA